ncbi:MAG TPA: hypothetical protein VIM71_05220 [Lacunisphaera sp.]
MKTPLIAIITAASLALGLMLLGRQVDVAFCVIVLFGTGLVAWTIEQYHHHRSR